ncbi:hypothetical protein [Methylobacterium indicum]|uniref:hypothetical protein n=1 Tax=Methylobacterium indicum TaxID=1775910 RepID=UPI000F79856D|nr:hypothetical protein [Methylobacterium indicum]
MMVTDHPVGFLATMTVIIGNPITPFTSLPAMPAQALAGFGDVRQNPPQAPLATEPSRLEGCVACKDDNILAACFKVQKKIVPHNALWCLNRDFTIFND